MGSWRFREIGSSRRRPVISVGRRRSLYRIDSPWLERTARDATEAGAVCCLTIDLVRSYLSDNAGIIGLHSAACEIGGCLVVFPSTVRAGKSTLVARLASEGHRIYADDFLPLVGRRMQARALGIAPRIRLPLPKSASRRFRAFIDAHAALRDQRYLFLDLPPALLAPHECTAEVGAVVLLDRSAARSAELAQLTRASGLQQLLLQNIAATPDSDVVAKLHRLVERVPCFRLTYSDLDTATRLLTAQFAPVSSRRTRASPEYRPPATRAAAARRRNPAPRATRQAQAEAGPRFVHSAGVREHSLDGELFLTGRGKEGVFRLNPVASALWKLTEQPVTQRAVVETLRMLFPGPERRRIADDVRMLFGRLRRAGLIRTAK